MPYKDIKKRKEQAKEYYYLHKKERIEYHKNYYQKHKKELQEYWREYYLKNKNKYDKYNKQWKKTKKGKKSVKETQNKLQKKYRQNPLRRLLNAYRNRIYYALKFNRKTAHTIELLGCSIEFFIKYIENQFTKGMTWQNYGMWHIDHIKRCREFDLSKKSEQFKCFNYSNLQPLWAKDNLIKHCICGKRGFYGTIRV